MVQAGKQTRQNAIDKATNLYWEKGFHGTSMRNLQEVIDMRPGSIYANFGSKEGLFKETLQHYAQQGIDNLLALKVSTGSPLQGLKLFVEQAVIGSQTDAPSSLCMLAKTISELTHENAPILAEAKRLLQKIEGHFESTFSEAKAAGELNSDQDATQLARHLQVQIMGLRTYSTINKDPQAMTKMIDELFATF